MSTKPVNWITRTAILMAMTLAFQVVLKLPQPLTGPVVNMFLYLSVILVGMWSGAVIGLATPVIAWIVGIMAAGPLVPVIQLGNASLCIVFGLIDETGKGKNIWIRILGIAAASVTKFLFISTSAKYLLSLPEPAAKAMGSPQLATALTGGVLAVLVSEALLRTGAITDRYGRTRA
ncbi:MAG: ECF transporter S component [Firmicutes bacterium]|nr:ECF transporter S component [Bacillota bacterium]